jgi:Ca2+-binding EF-hand superfamily protein
MRTFGGTGGLGGLGDMSVTRPLTTMSHVRQANSYEERLGLSRRGLRGMTPITPSNRGYAVQIAAEIKAARKRGEDPPLPASSREAARPRPPLVSARGASLAPPSPASARLLHTDRLPNTAPARVRDGAPLSSAAPQSPRSPPRSPSPSGGGAPWNLSPWRLTAPYVDIDAKAYKWPVEGAGASMRGLTLHGSGGGGSPRGGISNGAGAHRRTSALYSRAGLDGGGAGAVVGQPSQRLDRAMMHQLLRETSMTRTELYRLFNRFKALCKLSGTPGSINKHMFKEGVSSLAFEDDNFVDRVWKLLDVDRSGAVEWGEFVNAVNALETGSALDKLRFCFRVYDSDNSESIDREELHAMFSSMLLCAPGTGTRIPEASPALNELIEDFVNSIYDSFDADRNSALDFSEVLEALKRKGNEISDPWEIFGRTLVSRT